MPTTKSKSKSKTKTKPKSKSKSSSSSQEREHWIRTTTQMFDVPGWRRNAEGLIHDDHGGHCPSCNMEVDKGLNYNTQEHGFAGIYCPDCETKLDLRTCPACVKYTKNYMKVIGDKLKQGVYFASQPGDSPHYKFKSMCLNDKEFDLYRDFAARCYAPREHMPWGVKCPVGEAKAIKKRQSEVDRQNFRSSGLGDFDYTNKTLDIIPYRAFQKWAKSCPTCNLPGNARKGDFITEWSKPKYRNLEDSLYEALNMKELRKCSKALDVSMKGNPKKAELIKRFKAGIKKKEQSNINKATISGLPCQIINSYL